MVNKEQEDEFMKQYMEACKEQMEKLTKNPELFTQTLKPFMQMSKQLVEGGMLDGTMQNTQLLSGGLDLNVMITQLTGMNNYIKENYKELVASHNATDDVIITLDELSKKLRGLVKKLIEKIDDK
jgi:hypothetical protein